MASAAYRYRYPVASSASFFHGLDQERRERETTNERGEKGKEREREGEGARRETRSEKLSGREYLQNHEEYSAGRFIAI